jgi:hypothetical protein
MISERRVRMTRLLRHGLVGILALALGGSCVRIGPRTIPKDRFDYAAAINESWKSQILLNIVRLRYSDWPTFLEVNQIVAGYNWEHTANAKLNLKFSGGDDAGDLGYTGRYVERPTITYSPLVGEKFVRAILTPIRPAVLLSLVQSGWPADRTLEIMVQSINGHPNRSVGHGAAYRADEDFGRMVRLLRSAQVAGALAIKVYEKPESGDVAELGFRTQVLEAQARDELREMQRRLGLDPAPSYRVVWDSFAVDASTIAIQTRSALQVMVTLAVFVEVPEDHIEDRRAVKLEVIPPEDESGLPPLIRIHSGKSEPERAYAKVRYRDHWFWIEDGDPNSKRTFSYVSLLLTVTETGSAHAPQLTISTN